MSQSQTERLIERIQFNSALGAYALAWLFTIGLGLPQGWLLGLVTAAAYTGGYAYAMWRRGHVFLSADGVALPAAILAFGLFQLGSGLIVGVPGSLLEGLASLGMFGMAFVLGHVATIAYLFVSEAVLKIAFRQRLAAERDAG